MRGWPQPTRPFGVMGIVNVTPDSFFDGGQYVAPCQAVQRVRACVDDGADIVDLGAASSRPGSRPLSADEEVARLLPVLMGLQQERACTLSVDTWRSATAAMALQRGAGIINDISACQWDPALLDVLVQYRPGYVLMHCKGHPKDMQQSPDYNDVVSEVLSFFENALNKIVRAGLPEENIALDPGIGFGKRLQDNLRLLANVDRLTSFGRPILVGISMKSMFGELLGLPAGERGAATQTATALLWHKGVTWHRVHHVAMAVQGLHLACAIRGGSC